MTRFVRPAPTAGMDLTRPPNPGGYVPRQRHGQHLSGMLEGFNYDGKRMRLKGGMRKTVDHNCSLLNYVENRLWQRDYRDRRAIQADELYMNQMLPPPGYLDIPMNCVTTKFVRTSTNKIRCPIFCVCWTPEGRRLITGASSGEFTLWNGLTFNFETILQAHDTSVRAMRWSNNDQWMLTADHGGFVKYWQSNMNNVKMYQAHKDPVRDLRWASWRQPSQLFIRAEPADRLSPLRYSTRHCYGLQEAPYFHACPSRAHYSGPVVLGSGPSLKVATSLLMTEMLPIYFAINYIMCICTVKKMLDYGCIQVLKVICGYVAFYQYNIINAIKINFA